jgi:hypothetical protein
MFRRSQLRTPSHATIVAYLALFVALSGTAYAANTVGSADIIDESILSRDIKNGRIGTPDLHPNSVTGGKVLPFSLSNQDVGVLFAQVNADGTLAASSGGVQSVNVAGGQYSVDFGRNISSCAFVMTQGEASVGGAEGAITGATDRAGDNQAVYATVRTDAGAFIDRAFQLIVVC